MFQINSQQFYHAQICLFHYSTSLFEESFCLHFPFMFCVLYSYFRLSIFLIFMVKTITSTFKPLIPGLTNIFYLGNTADALTF